MMRTKPDCTLNVHRIRHCRSKTKTREMYTNTTTNNNNKIIMFRITQGQNDGQGRGQNVKQDRSASMQQMLGKHIHIFFKIA
jgi:hypothetical protein